MFVPKAATAAQTCQTIFPNGPYNPPEQFCQVGIPVPSINGHAFDSLQKQTNWCWAACMHLVFRWHGHYVPQEDIVERVFGSQVNQALPGHVIAAAASSVWQDSTGAYLKPQVQVLIDTNFGVNNSLSADLAIADLLAEKPMIIGTQGHATVVTAIEYTQSIHGVRTIRNVRVRDPWPLNPNSRSLTPSEYYGTDFLMRVAM